MSGIFNNLTPVLQVGVKSSLIVNTMFFGVDSRIYYPKDIKEYSGQYNDIDYHDEPQFEGMVIIPEIYSIHQYILAGSFNYELEECTMYIDDHNIPNGSKVVALTDIGDLTFIVDHQDDYITLKGKIAVIYKLTPVIADKNKLQDLELADDIKDINDDVLEDFDYINGETFDEFGFKTDDEVYNSDDFVEEETTKKTKSQFIVL